MKKPTTGVKENWRSFYCQNMEHDALGRRLRGFYLCTHLTTKNALQTLLKAVDFQNWLSPPPSSSEASLTCKGTSCQEPTTKNFPLRWPRKVSLWKVRPRDRHKAQSPHQSCKRVEILAGKIFPEVTDREREAFWNFEINPLSNFVARTETPPTSADDAAASSFPVARRKGLSLAHNLCSIYISSFMTLVSPLTSLSGPRAAI